MYATYNDQIMNIEYARTLALATYLYAHARVSYYRDMRRQHMYSAPS